MNNNELLLRLELAKAHLLKQRGYAMVPMFQGALEQYAATIEAAIKALSPSATGAPVAWMYEESGERMFGHPDGYRPKDAVPLYAGCHHDASQPSPTTREQP